MKLGARLFPFDASPGEIAGDDLRTANEHSQLLCASFGSPIQRFALIPPFSLSRRNHQWRALLPLSTSSRNVAVTP